MFRENEIAITHPTEALTAFIIVLVIIAFIFTTLDEVVYSRVSDESDLYIKSIDIAEFLMGNTGLSTTGSTSWEKNISNLLVLGLGLSNIVEGYIIVGNETYNTTGSDINAFLSFQLQNFTRLYPISDPPFPPNITIYPERRDPMHIDLMYIAPSSQGYVYSFKMQLCDDSLYGVIDYDKVQALKNVSYEKAKEALGIDWRYNFIIRVTYINGTVLLDYPSDADYEHASTVTHFVRNVVIYKSGDIDPSTLEFTSPAMELGKLEVIIYR